jgi:hypothetical protein
MADTPFWLVVAFDRTSDAHRTILYAECVHETEAEARQCLPEPVFSPDRDWIERDVMSSDAYPSDPEVGPFLETWRDITERCTSAVYDPARAN